MIVPEFQQIVSRIGKLQNSGVWRMSARIVLLAIDGTQQAEAAFQWYLDNIHRDGNRMIVLHCIDFSALSLEEDEEGISAVAASWDRTDTRIKELEASYKWKLNENGIIGKVKTESGKPAEVICKAAKEERATMIVIGSRGVSKLKRTLGGSVSDHVLHNAPCPVVICKTKDTKTESPKDKTDQSKNKVEQSKNKTAQAKTRIM